VNELIADHPNEAWHQNLGCMQRDCQYSVALLCECTQIEARREPQDGLILEFILLMTKH
jgi:hypothetical protein